RAGVVPRDHAGVFAGPSVGADSGRRPRARQRSAGPDLGRCAPRRELSPSHHAGRPYLQPRSLQGTRPDWRDGPARQRESPLPPSLRRVARDRRDLRPRAIQHDGRPELHLRRRLPPSGRRQSGAIDEPRPGPVPQRLADDHHSGGFPGEGLSHERLGPAGLRQRVGRCAVKRMVLTIGAIAVALALMVSPLRAQWVVYDPSNYFEAVAEYEQLIQQYQFLLAQARRVPVDIESRYHGYSLDWTFYDLAGLLYAQPLLTALNQ